MIDPVETEAGRRWIWLIIGLLMMMALLVIIAAIVLLTLAGCAALAHGLTIVTKAIAGQALLQVAWYRTQAGGVPERRPPGAAR